MLESANESPRRKPHRDPALDGLRGLAVLLVFLFHYGGALESQHLLIHLLGLATSASWTGLILFFALSGFLITGILWDSRHAPHHLRNFYLRRALRILPLYYFALFAAAVYSIARGSTFVEIRPLTAYALFLQNLPLLAKEVPIPSSSLPLYHLWTLAVEEQFYLLWPACLLLAATHKRALRLCLWAFALSALFRLLAYTLLPPLQAMQSLSLNTSVLTQLGPFALGAALALTLRDPNPRLQRLAAPALVLGLALFALASYLTGNPLFAGRLQFILGLPGISIAAAALISIALRPGLPRQLLSLMPLAFIGRISYGIYIFHVLLTPFFDTLATRLTHTTSGDLYQTTCLLVAFPITLVVAWLSFHLLELPFLHVQRRFPLSPPLPQQ
jgi:peptidoglycan/LPS O-acetylase OafA/YrhL